MAMPPVVIACCRSGRRRRRRRRAAAPSAGRARSRAAAARGRSSPPARGSGAASSRLRRGVARDRSSTTRSTSSLSASRCVTTTTPSPSARPARDVLPEAHVGAVVEALVGLVEQQHARAAEQRQREVDLLARAARQVPASGCARRSGTRTRPAARGPRGSPPRAREPERRREQREVLVGAQQIEQPGLLRAVADPALDLDVAAVRAHQPGADAQQRALAGAVLADDRDRLRRRPPTARRCRGRVCSPKCLLIPDACNCGELWRSEGREGVTVLITEGTFNGSATRASRRRSPHGGDVERSAASAGARSGETRELELDPSAAWGPLRHSHAPFVGLGDRAHDRQPEPRATRGAVAARVGAMEAVEDALALVLGRMPGPSSSMTKLQTDRRPRAGLPGARVPLPRRCARWRCSAGCAAPA